MKKVPTSNDSHKRDQPNRRSKFTQSNPTQTHLQIQRPRSFPPLSPARVSVLLLTSTTPLLLFLSSLSSSSKSFFFFPFRTLYDFIFTIQSLFFTSFLSKTPTPPFLPLISLFHFIRRSTNFHVLVVFFVVSIPYLLTAFPFSRVSSSSPDLADPLRPRSGMISSFTFSLS